MANPASAAPVGQAPGLQVMSATGAPGKGTMAGETHGPDYGQGDVAGHDNVPC